MARRSGKGRYWKSRVPGPLKRPLRALSHWIGYPFRALLSRSFQGAVKTLRVLRILPSPSTGNGPLRVLIVHLTSHLGDTVLQMPMIEALRAAHPTARIEFATEESAAPLLRRMTELDKVHALRLRRDPPVTLLQAMRRSLQVMQAYWKFMRDVSPDVCLVPRWDDDLFRSRVLASLTGAPKRVGFAWNVVSQARPAPYRDAFLTQVVRGGSGLHEATRYCLLAHEAGLIPQAAVDEAGRRPIAALQRMAAEVDWAGLAERLGIERDRPFAVVAPGASMARRIWPLDNWSKVCESLEASGFQIVLLSGNADRAVAEQLHERNGGRGVLAAGKTSLIESAALLYHASLFLGSDSGPGHLAGALGVPSVVLFITMQGLRPDGVSSAERIRPVGPLVECCYPPRRLDPCDGACVSEEAHCITLIEPDTVMEAVHSVLKRAEVEQPLDSSLAP